MCLAGSCFCLYRCYPTLAFCFSPTYCVLTACIWQILNLIKEVLNDYLRAFKDISSSLAPSLAALCTARAIQIGYKGRVFGSDLRINCQTLKSELRKLLLPPFSCWSDDNLVYTTNREVCSVMLICFPSHAVWWARKVVLPSCYSSTWSP